MATIARTASDLEDLGGQRRTVGEKLTQLEALRNQEKTQVSAVDAAAQKLTSLEGIEEGIAGLRAAIATAQKGLGPMEREQHTLEARVTECRDQDAQARKRTSKLSNARATSACARSWRPPMWTCSRRPTGARTWARAWSTWARLQADRDAIRGLVARLVPSTRRDWRPSSPSTAG